MSRPVGLPKTGGRKRGTPNKRSSDLTERLAQLNCDPIGDIVALLPALTERERLAALADLLPYVYPKRKSMEMDVAIATSEAATPDLDAASRSAELNRMLKNTVHIRRIEGVLIDKGINDQIDLLFPPAVVP